MQLLKLTLRLPGCLTTIDAEGDLPCTLVRIAASTLTRTAAAMLASAIEDAAAADRVRAPIRGEEDDDDAVKGEGGLGGVFALPLPPTFEHEPVSQLFVFGQLADPEAIPAAAKCCGLELALTDEGAISSMNEGQLHAIGCRILQRHLATKGYIRVFDHVYVPASQLFAPASSGSEIAPRFLEGIKLLPLLDTRTTSPFVVPGGEGGVGGVLGLAISFEPQVYKWTPVDWAAIRAFAARRREEREAQRALVYDDGGGAHYSQEEEADGLHPFLDGEAALELLAVKALPGLTGRGVVTSLPTPTPNPTGLLRANQRHGFDLHIPTTDAAMRRFWLYTYQIDFPHGVPLEYIRIRFKGQDFGRAFTYPCPCLAHDVALAYARTTQARAYTRLSRHALDLLAALPGVLQAVYHSSSTLTAQPSTTSTTTVARPAAPTSTAILALTPVKAGRAHVNAEGSSGLALTSARQLRDHVRAQPGGEEGGVEPGGVVLLLPTTTSTIPTTEEEQAPLPPSAPLPAPTITTGRGAKPAAAAAAAVAAAAITTQRPHGKQPRVLSLFDDDDEAEGYGQGGGGEEEGYGGEGEAGPPPLPPMPAAATAAKQEETASKTPQPPKASASASALMPPPAAPAKSKRTKAKGKGKAAAAALAGSGVGGKRKEPGGGVGGGGAKGGKKKAKAT